MCEFALIQYKIETNNEQDIIDTFDDKYKDAIKLLLEKYKKWKGEVENGND